MEPKMEKNYKKLKEQAKAIMKSGNLKEYIAKLIEIEALKQQLTISC
jgi:uncharacterized protein YeeX (DUF496 family)